MGLLSKLIGVIPNNVPVSTDESLWALALSEFNGLNRRPGLWAQSLANAGGDESKAQAAYLKARYDELAERHVRVKVLEQAEAEALALMQTQSQGRARTRADARTRSQSGLCPSCYKMIPLESDECSNCGFLFDKSPGSLRIKSI